jgi:tight adherence protein B
MFPTSALETLASSDLAVYAVPAVFALLAVGLLTAFAPRLFGKSDLEKRLQRIATGPATRTRGAGTGNARGAMAGRRRSVEEVLAEIEDQQQEQRKRQKLTLKRRLTQAGLDWSARKYGFVTAGCAGAAFLVALVGIGLGLLPAIGFAAASALLGPRLIIDQARKSRFKQFAKEFPNALDVIVRGVRSGLPLIDCFRIVSAEARDPVRSEFRRLLEDQTVGVPLDEAVHRLYERMPVSEANFFAIVIAMQSRTGGSLSEALANLSNVLRERRKLTMKISALSSEAKASAGIIGALPVVVTVMVYFTTPDYIMLLFTTLIGQLTLAGSGIWMFVGIMVMRKMINFKY